jgi:5'-deoxynucleotidase YfbR-like HD superfamily hydrolase
MIKEDDYDWVADCRGGAEVKRGHTLPLIREYTVGHHTFNAQMIAMYLAQQNDLNPRDRLNLFIMISIHDIPELFTGDMPSNFKNAAPYIAEKMKEAEVSWIQRHIPEDMRVIMGHDEVENKVDWIAKLSDWLELMWWCVEELEMGNRRISHVYNNIRGTIKNFMDYHHEIKGVFKMFEDLQQRADEVLNYGG